MSESPSRKGATVSDSVQYVENVEARTLLQRLAESVIRDLPDDPYEYLIELLHNMPAQTEDEVRQDDAKTGRNLVVLHFNDVYNIDPRAAEPSGGASRFATKVKEFAPRHPLVLFSGDAFNPSMLSTVSGGKHMVPVLNELGVHTSCLGNHDLDFGPEQFERLIAGNTFPWLCANVLDTDTGKPICGCDERRVFEWQGVTVGVVGVVESEWLATLGAVDTSKLEYEDFVTCANRHAREMREQGADVIIALTHMREPNDRRLAREGEGIHLVLGGHDHHYVTDEINGTTLVKSGTDFRDLSAVYIHTWRDRSGASRVRTRVERIPITSDIPEDEAMQTIVDEFKGGVGARLERAVGETSVELDARFSSVRTRETNIGNFIADLMRESMKGDCAIINGGCIRLDGVIEPGAVKMKDIISLVPMTAPLVKVAVTGRQLAHVLENSVSQYPKLEGRFAQVSGLAFKFDSRRPPGHRVDTPNIKIGDSLIDMDKEYSVVTSGYLASGKDGYDAFAEGRVLVDDEEGAVIPTLMRNHFVALDVIKGLVQNERMLLRVKQRFIALRHHDKHTESYSISPKVEGRVVNIAEA